MRRQVNVLVGMLLLVALTVALHAQDQPAAAPVFTARESVLDRKVHLEKEWVLEIPQVPRWCDLLTLKKSRVNIGDCELHCEEEGLGPPLVLVNGGPGNTHHCFHPAFSVATNFSRVIYYDQRGCGLSDYKPGAGYSTAQAIDDLDKLRVALKINRWVVAARHDPKLTPNQQVYNSFLCGEWKLQSWFYRPSNEAVARFIRYDDGQNPRFRKTLNMNTPDVKDYFQNCPIPTLILEGKYDMT